MKSVRRWVHEDKQEIIEANDHNSFAGCYYLEQCSAAEEWLHTLELMENSATCPEGLVTSDIYMAVRVSDDRIVGVTEIRHHYNAAGYNDIEKYDLVNIQDAFGEQGRREISDRLRICFTRT